MSNNNPTPQPDIDELREKVEDYLDRADTEKVVNVGQFADEIMQLYTSATEKAVRAAEIKLLEHLLRPEMYKLNQEKFNEKVAGRVHIELSIRRETEAELQATNPVGGEG